MKYSRFCAISHSVFIILIQITIWNVDQVKEDAKYIKDARVVEIPTMYGHMGASATYRPADVDFDNRVVREFLDDVTKFGKKIK